MPLYEYECPAGHRSEALRPYSERDTPTLCPKGCGKPAKAVLSPCNYSFGWRLTDESHTKGNPDKLEADI